jgi:HEAT repeat protein
MEKYFTETVFNIAFFLFILSGATGVVTVVYASLAGLASRNMSVEKAFLLKAGYLREMVSRGRLPESAVPGLLLRMFSLNDILDMLSGKGPDIPEEEKNIIMSGLRKPGFTDKIERWAKRRNKWRRIKSIIIIGYLDTPRAFEILRKAVLSKDEDTAYFALLSFGRIKKNGSVDMIFNVLSVKRFSGYKVASILETFPPEFDDKIAEYMDDMEEESRYWALKVLSRKASLKFIKRICELTNDESADIRAAACEYLGNSGCAETAGFLEARLEDDAWFVRIHAIRSLEKLLDDGFSEKLLSCMQDENLTVRETAKGVVTRHMNKAAPRIYELLRDGDESVRKNCLEVIDRSGLTEKLIERILSADESVKYDAMKVFSELVKADSRFGIQGVLEKMPPDDVETILRIVGEIDPGKYEYIRKTLRKRRS